jgi:hypothetical protein
MYRRIKRGRPGLACVDLQARYGTGEKMDPSIPGLWDDLGNGSRYRGHGEAVGATSWYG